MPNLDRHIEHATAYAVLIRCLVEGSTQPEMVEETGMTAPTIGRLLRILHRHKTIHISAWEKDTANRSVVRVWMLGTKPDAKKPRKSMKQRNAEQYAKKQQIAMLTGARIKDVRISGYRVSPMGTLEAAA